MEIWIEAVKEGRVGFSHRKMAKRDNRQGLCPECGNEDFSGGHGFCIKDRLHYPIEGIAMRTSWIDRIFPQPAVFEGADVEAFTNELNRKNLPNPPGVVVDGLEK